MGDIGSDATASIELANEAVEKLFAINPTHPLLKYMILPPEDAGTDGNPKDPAKEEAIRVEMKDRFWRRGKSWREESGALVVAVVYSNYWVALRRAIDGKEGDSEPEPSWNPSPSFAVESDNHLMVLSRFEI